MAHNDNRHFGILRSQARACRDAAAFVLPIVLLKKVPADKLIASFFRNNRKYGSKDRRIIYEAVFAAFRWWGWVGRLGERLISDDVIRMAEDGKIITEDFFSNRDLTLFLAGAALIENSRHIPDEITSVWLDELGIHKRMMNENKGNSIEDKLKLFHAVSKSVNKETSSSFSDLIPEWTRNYFDRNIDFRKLVEWYQKRPPIWIRVNNSCLHSVTSEFSRLGISYSVHPQIANAVSIKHSTASIYTLDTFKEGCFEIQDIASQVIGIACGAAAGQRWWDACAGAGGKSLQLSSMMNNKGTIVATDIREYKLEDLRTRARRAGNSNIQCREWDGKALDKKKHRSFDGILIDAPCSCSGTWRRNPDARWRISREETEELANTQLMILQNASSGVKKTGTLVYATCSVFDLENNAVIGRFLETNKDFALAPFVNPLTGKTTDGTLQILPWEADSDAMFVSRLTRMD